MKTDVPITLNFEQLPAYQRRFFVPASINLTVLEEVRPLYDALVKRPIDSRAAFEQWILDRSELEAALNQAGTIIYIRMTCQTDDVSRAQAYQHFIETIRPAAKMFEDQLNQKYLAEQMRWQSNQEHYGIYTRKIKTDVALFVQENVALETQVDLCTQEYQTIIGSMTVEFEGKERTLPEMGKFLLEPDRELRQRAFSVAAKRRLHDKERLEGLFDQLLSSRIKIAQNAGCANFMEYKFRHLHRFDYTPLDCKQYHRSIEQLVVPVWREILARRKKEMGLMQLRPWDTAVDPLKRAPLRPFTKTGELIEGCIKIFERLDPGLGRQFLNMVDLGLLDLESRKGKAPGGYQSTLEEARKPFIFMNAVGVDDDVRTLFHEAGHAFHALACAHHSLLDYRHGPMEFNEVASMGMELLADPYLALFYSAKDEERSRREHWEGIVFTLIWVATIDCFQHWIYEHPGHNVKERRQSWLAIYRRFGGNCLDWQGLEEIEAFLWHRQLHIFEVPFYYIEYGIAQLGALQLWCNAQKDKNEALTCYKNALSLGGSRPLQELFKAAGIRFDFSLETIELLIAAVQGQLKL